MLVGLFNANVVLKFFLTAVIYQNPTLFPDTVVMETVQRHVGAARRRGCSLAHTGAHLQSKVAECICERRAQKGDAGEFWTRRGAAPARVNGGESEFSLVINRFAAGAMRKMSGKLMLCVLLLFITLSWAEDAKMSGKTHNNTGKAGLFYDVKYLLLLSLISTLLLLYYYY